MLLLSFYSLRRDSPFYIPTGDQPKLWEVKHKRIAGVSSFGFGGANAHVVIEEAPEQLLSDKRTNFSQDNLLISIFPNS